MSKSNTVEVIGAGCGRTGTASLKKALEILGYPSYHMIEVFANGHSGSGLEWPLGSLMTLTKFS